MTKANLVFGFACFVKALASKALILIFTIGAILLVQFVFACSCPPPGKSHEMRLKSYERSKAVFTGIASHVAKDHVVFRVSEIFKGEITDTIVIHTKESCSVFPEKNEEWIIYAEDLDDETLMASQCLLSRRIDTLSQKISIPIPPPPGQQIEDVPINSAINCSEVLEKLILMEEVNWLRAIGAEVNTIPSPNMSKTFHHKASVQYISIALSGLCLILLMIVLLKVFRKKEM